MTGGRAARPTASTLGSLRLMADDQARKQLWPMGSLYELAMLVLFEIIVLELLRRTGRSFGLPGIAIRTWSDMAR